MIETYEKSPGTKQSLTSFPFPSFLSLHSLWYQKCSAAAGRTNRLIYDSKLKNWIIVWLASLCMKNWIIMKLQRATDIYCFSTKSVKLTRLYHHNLRVELHLNSCSRLRKNKQEISKVIQQEIMIQQESMVVLNAPWRFYIMKKTETHPTATSPSTQARGV